MIKRLLTLLLIFAPGLQTFAQVRVNMTVSTQQQRKAISPYIYGTNDNYEHAPAKRFGGNRITNYNWETNASNAGFDWRHHSDDYVPWEQGVPESQYNVPGAALRAFHQKSLNQGAYSLITLPMAKYVTADKNGTVTEAEAAPSLRWNDLRYRKPGALSLTPDLTDRTVYADEEINFLLQNYGPSGTPTGVRGYALDNEPGLWFHTHSRMFGHNNVTVDYLMRNSYELAARIKELDPGAEVFGPASWGITEFESLQFAPDWEQVRGHYPTFLDYYLAKMKEKQDADPNRRRLLDVLDLHWYPQTRNDGASPFSNQTDYLTNQARMEMTRSLWDSTYVENTWVGNDPFKVEQFLPFLPKISRHINTYYPGTKFAITEYSYMGTSHPSGGIAQADALGAFGRHGVYMATYWGGVTGYIRSGFDLYRNYDGQGGSFGDISVQATTSDVVNSSVHASVRSEDERRTHLIVLNKNQDGPIVATIKIDGNVQYKSARVYAFDGTSTTLRQLRNIRVITNNEFEYTIPALTACHIVLTEEDLSVFPEVETATITPDAGWSDGTASYILEARVSDGDNNITSVTADLSPLGGAANAALVLADAAQGLYRLQQDLPAGAASGLKPVKLTVRDADGRRGEYTLFYRVIKKTQPAVIWDGDSIRRGVGDRFYDAPDSLIARNSVIERRATGGENNSGSMYLHFVHGYNKYSTMTWRTSENNNPADGFDLSDYGYLEFKIRSNAPAGSDVEFSLRDASAGLYSSNSVMLKQGGYVNAFNPDAFTRVKIPISVLKTGSQINLDQVWQFNFNVNTAVEGFDVWIDDIRGLPYSHPYKQPLIAEAGVSPQGGYADGLTRLSLTAAVSDPDGDLKEVYADLSELGGSNHQALSPNGQGYGYTFTLPQGLAYGDRQLRLSAADSAGNVSDRVLPFKVYQVAQTEVLWDGDVKNTGAVVQVDSISTATVRPTGGNKQPKRLNFHFDQSVAGFASAQWDWNLNTGDTQLKDLSNKRYLNFYLKLDAPSEYFDLEVFFKDRFTASTDPIRIKEGGYLQSFTGQYQHVRIPLSAFFHNKRIDEKQVTRIGFLSNRLGTDTLDFSIDDIYVSGSTVADVTINVQDAGCGQRGSISVAAVAGQEGPFTYLINGQPNPAGAANPVFTGLQPGSYLLRVANATGFVYMEQVTVGGTVSQLELSGTVSGSNIDVTVNGGSGSYTYLWNNGATTEDLSGLAPGTYTLTVTDTQSGCQASYTASIAAPSAVFELTDANCAPNGSIRVSGISNLPGSISYYLNGEPNPAGADSALFSNLRRGTYLVELRSSSGAGLSRQLSVGGYDSAPVLSGVVNGTAISLEVSGGSGSYNYLWSNGATTRNLSGLEPGQYGVTVTDSLSGCTATASFSIIGSSQPRAEVTDAACGANGSIKLHLPAGLQNLVCTMNGKPNPAGAQNILFSNLKPGTYTVKATAAGGFSFQQRVTVGGTGPAPVVTGVVKKNIIDITVKGGSGMYIYQWSEGSTTQDLWEVPDGTYTVVVTDAYSLCTTSFTATVLVPGAQLSVKDAVCGANGAITLSDVKGGNGNYSYFINNKPNPAGAAEPVFGSLKPGNYTVKVTDNAGFVYTATAKVGGYASKPAVALKVRGRFVDATVTGGSGMYIYQWSEGSTTQDLMDVPDGTYTLLVTDAASGCTAQATATVFVPTAELQVQDAACAANGQVRVAGTNGTGSLKYYLNNKLNPAGADQPVFGSLKPGIYTVKVEGGNGFVWTGRAEVKGSAAPPQVRSVVTGNSVVLNVSGGSGIYGYQWNEGSTTRDLAEVAAGTYTVQVTDLGTGCSASHSVNVAAAKVSALTIYPNPVQSGAMLNIGYLFKTAAARTISLHDLNGKIIHTQAVSLAQGELNIQLPVLRTGIYIIRVSGRDAEARQLMIKE